MWRAIASGRGRCSCRCVHPPGHAQVDFGEALGVIGGVERKIHFFAIDLPHSDACFVLAYPAETTEAFCDGHVKAFEFFGGVPQIDSLRQHQDRGRAHSGGWHDDSGRACLQELQSHYLFEDRFGRPGKGNDKGQSRGAGRLCAAQLPGADPGVRQLRGAQRASTGVLPPSHERPLARP